MSGPRIDTPFLVNTLQALVRINSVNPHLVPGAPGEAAIIDHLDGVLRGLGLRVSRCEATAGRPSLLARLAGRGGGRSLMLNAHVDTVGVGQMVDPFSGRVEHGRLFGRGSYDMKGGLAASIAAVKALVESGSPHRGDVVIAAVADEEYASEGTQAVLEHCRTDGAVVTEPTGLDVCLAHKGFMWFEIEATGHAAHGSRFDLGIDANMRMGRVLQRLEVLERALRQGRQHPLVGPASLHAATLHGGTGLSTYAATCVLQVERRTIPGESAREVEREVQDLLDAVEADDPTCRFRLRTLLERPAFEVAADAPLVRVLTSCATAVRGRPPGHLGQTPWMDSALLAAAGVETVVFGADGAGAHADEEWADLASVQRLAQILVQAAAEYCR